MRFYTAMSAGLGTKVGVPYSIPKGPFTRIPPGSNTSIDTVAQTIVSESKPSAFPSALRAKRSAVQTLSAEDRKTEAITDKTCERCGRTQMFFTTVQLRSADEGSTVFFRCVCGYKYVHAIPHFATNCLGGQFLTATLSGKPKTTEQKPKKEEGKRKRCINLGNGFYVWAV